jgi:hypothetical protein
MINSVKEMVDEVKITVIDSKKSGAVQSIKETIKDASEIYRSTQNHKR